jgi:hypothetical protein
MKPVSLPTTGLRRIARLIGRTIGAVAMVLALPVTAATLTDDSSLVGSEVAPVSREFDITQTGSYQLQLTDLGFPANLQSLKAAVTLGSGLVASASAPGNLLFNATAGHYKVLIAGIPAVAGGFGSFGVKVLPAAGGADVLNYSDSIHGTVVAATPGQSTLQTQFTVDAAGSHRIALVDVGFPVPLAAVDVLVARSGVQYARLDATHPTADFDAPAGPYDLLVVAQAAAPALAGLYTVKVTNLAGGTAVYDKSHPVGHVEAAETVNLPSSGAYTLVLTDLQFPQSLATVGAALTRGATVFATTNAAGSISFNATAGAAQLYSLHVPTASGSGAGAVELLFGTSRFFSNVYVDSPALSSGSSALFRNEFQVVTAGQYRATLADFDFPGSFLSEQLAIVQDGQLLGKRTGVGQLDFSASVGKVQLLTAVQPNPASGSGLAGLQVTSQPSGTAVFETTQAVGALFQSRTVEITQGGSYDLSLSDLGFPANFTELALAVTRGTNSVGSIFGGGKFSFTATPGTYFLNLIGRVNSSAKFAAYGLKVESTPPAPAVTLTASPLSIASGATTTLTWTTTAATSCVASDAWTGTKATSGTQTSGSLTVDSKFTLTCTGPGGSTAASVTVTLKKPSPGGGGGAVDALLLALVLLAVYGRRISRAVR